MPHHNTELAQEIRNAAGKLPLYPGDPHGVAVDYTNASVAFAVNVSLLRGNLAWHPSGLYLPTPATKVLLVRRASGDGEVGSWSGVSGYVDTLHDPEGQLTDEAFDPITYAARAELKEELGIPWEEIRSIDLHLGAIVQSGIHIALGQRFDEERYGRHGIINILPFAGVCYSEPHLKLNRDELSDFQWVAFKDIARIPNLSSGYLRDTLPKALQGLGLRMTAIQDIINSSKALA